MTALFGIIVKNRLYYRQKTVLGVLLAGLLLFFGAGSILLVRQVKALADKPLESLKTEILIQVDKTNKNPGEVKTSGIIQPFDLDAFDRDSVLGKLRQLPGVEAVSAALVLWQFDLSNTKTMVGIDVGDPRVGLRDIQSFLMAGGEFFSGNDAEEVILERHFAKLFGYEQGKSYPLAGKQFRIVGVVDFKEQSNLSNAQIFLPYGTALRLAGLEGRVANQAYVSLASASKLGQVTSSVTAVLPGYSIITKDSLLKNLSGLVQTLYRFGDYFGALAVFFSVLLAGWVIRLQRLEFREQTEILKLIGWPRRQIRNWALLDTGLVLAAALVCAAALTAAADLLLISRVVAGPLLNQGFSL